MASDPSHTPSGHRRHGPFLLRNAHVDDARAIEAVHWAAREAVYDGQVADWPPSGLDRDGRIERWTRWLSSEHLHCIVGEEDGRIVGFVTIRASRDEDAEPHVAEMPTLYVDPAAWRRGLGAALCRAAVALASALDFLELTLWVVEVNTRAQRFYDAFGFVADGASQVDEDTTERLVARRYRLSLGAE